MLFWKISVNEKDTGPKGMHKEKEGMNDFESCTSILGINYF